MNALAKIDALEEEVVNNILAAWHRASDTVREQGAQWYLEQQGEIRLIGARTDTAPETVAAVVAHTSPRMQWVRNLEVAESVIRTGTAVGVMSACRDRALAALNSDDPLSTINGLKTKNFALNLLGSPDAVTVDVWACRVAFGIARGTEVFEKYLGRKGAYEAVADCYRIAAARVGVSPSTMQATTWIVLRGRA